MDCGCNSRQDVEKLGVTVGDIISVDSNLAVLNKFLVGKGLDNKISSFILVEIAKRLQDVPYTVYLSNLVQEEVGNKGAKMIINSLRPDYVIVLEVSHDTNIPIITENGKADIKCGKGPIVVKAPCIHRGLYSRILQCAQDISLPIQLDVNGQQSDTDADVIAYENGGTPCALICTPMRYMHSTKEFVQISDVEDVIELTLSVLESF